MCVLYILNNIYSSPFYTYLSVLVADYANAPILIFVAFCLCFFKSTSLIHFAHRECSHHN
ncbi:hypothetical protein T4D_5333 [Trichinella pseudospiralis]|uniref:Uncharacterized protein n=1 Tax=Trichinella pseudospiralis TaxID=6337 RepID=A0A0V1FTZ6_TRIPS|nr:hypothetical protein T4D_5333 [Trichinella pseudospiralis]